MLRKKNNEKQVILLNIMEKRWKKSYDSSLARNKKNDMIGEIAQKTGKYEDEGNWLYSYVFFRSGMKYEKNEKSFDFGIDFCICHDADAGGNRICCRG